MWHDSWLKVLGTKNVFSIGDCAYMLNNSLPSTAQVASQEGAYLGRLFSKGYFMKVPAKLPPLKKIVEESDDANYFSELVNVGNLAVTVENIDKVRCLCISWRTVFILAISLSSRQLK